MNNKFTYNLFVQGGCLSREAMQRFAEGLLTSEEMIPVQAHLKHCPLCADALEGYMLYNDPDQFVQSIEKLGLQIQSQLIDTMEPAKKAVHPEHKKRTLYILTVAASVIIMLGLFSIIQVPRLRETKLTLAQNYESPAPVVLDTLLPPPAIETNATIQAKTAMQNSIISEKKKTGANHRQNYETSLPKDLASGSRADGKETPKLDKVTNDAVAVASVSEVIEIVVPEPERKKSEVEDRYFAAGYSTKSASVNGRNLASMTGLKNETSEIIFAVVDEMPKFKNKGVEEFQKYIREHIEYPEKAFENNIEGTVVVGFIVDQTGQVTNLKLINTVDSLLDAEALRVVKSSPVWKPGKQSGKPVSVSVTIPVCFRLHPD